MCIGLGQGDMTEAEGFGVAVRAYYYAVMTTKSWDTWCLAGHRRPNVKWPV